ncbi:GntR family transcriptional regulator [Consotaella salsifontis]|uniref:Transcriptional regulator, GntR family n=1 Tax=Consotaella salsifontis TaxID=1365950 RepID=A0A1T4R9L0_9HYPH|nr:GntR family transcriptional regulator [Consotaella salsifontis]SKA12643.1 transcriptional regulator, GntR family [Consotaella salsifontis]
MGTELKSQRRYREIAERLQQDIASGRYQVGERLPPERELAELFAISRPTIREALIMLEILGLVQVRVGSGVYVLSQTTTLPERPDTLAYDIGPFELLQARQLIESEVAAFAAIQTTKNDITRMRDALEMERTDLAAGDTDYRSDHTFHLLIAEATQNSVLLDAVKDLWARRQRSAMWQQLHARIVLSEYRQQWLIDHQTILAALRARSPQAARAAMWQHLQHVRETLLAVSDVEDPHFDGFLFAPPETTGAGAKN